MIRCVQIDISNVLKRDSEAFKLAQEELLDACADWTSSAWDELDWSRIKEMTVRDLLDKRKVAASTAQQRKCLDCPSFVKHV